MQGGKSYSIISDHLGTPILAVDTNGVKVWERELDIYGKVRKEFTSDDVANRRSGFMPFLYAGQYYDKETDLAYNRFRYYSPDTGTYISQDPIGLAGGNPTLYGYVHDSNSWFDVFGLNEINDLGQIGEKNAEITKNTKRISSASKKVKFRIPDEMSDDGRLIKEVKNVNYQYFSSQLKDDLEYINRDGGKGTLILIVDNRTKLSSKLQREIDDGKIILERKDLNKKQGCH